MKKRNQIRPSFNSIVGTEEKWEKMGETVDCLLAPVHYFSDKNKYDFHNGRISIWFRREE